jgi:S1-C subfamily serine protease
MPSVHDVKVPPEDQPNPAEYAFDLDAAMSAVVGLRAVVPEDAFTAQTLGTERAGNGVLIRNSGLVLTIGYLITEAESIWLSPASGSPVPGHALAYDQETGFGLVQALARLDLPALTIGDSAGAQVGDRVVVAGAGGKQRSVAARIVAKQEFAGYWEYVLDEAIFTTPAHPNWGGTAMIGSAGDLLGIGSLQMQQAPERGKPGGDLNMIVPIDLVKPILDDMLKTGRANRPPRPWLGVFTAENDGDVVVMNVSDGSPAAKAGLQRGDIISDIRDGGVDGLADFYRKVWGSGEAGAEVPMRIVRDGRDSWVRIKSADRNSFLRRPHLQ